MGKYFWIALVLFSALGLVLGYALAYGLGWGGEGHWVNGKFQGLSGDTGLPAIDD